jgi:type II secretory pathway pseudopilin PulG
MRIHRRKRTAFTITELLVAVTITVLIVVLLGSIFGSLIGTSTQASQRIDTYRDARAALQLMRKDFEALVTARPAAYLSLDPDNGIGPDVRQLCGLVSAKNKPSGGAVPGDLCAVRYYSLWDSTLRIYTLHRYFKDSDQTISTFKGALSGGTLSYVNGTSLYYDGVGADEVVANCAWNIQIVAYDASGNIINSTSDVFGFPTSGPYTCDPSGSTATLPASLEISFKAISSEAARAVGAATAGRNDAYEVWKVVDNNSPASGDQTLYNNLIRPHVEDFRTRIYLK